MLPVIPQIYSGFGEECVRDELSVTHTQTSQFWSAGISFCALMHLHRGFCLKTIVKEHVLHKFLCYPQKINNSSESRIRWTCVHVCFGVLVMNSCSHDESA